MFNNISLIFSIISIFSCSYMSAQNTGDTITINFSSSKILIISAEEEDEWDFEAEEEADAKKKDRTLKLKPELLIGANGYISSSNNLSLPNEYTNMSVNYSRSRGFTVNMMLKLIDQKNQ